MSHNPPEEQKPKKEVLTIDPNTGKLIKKEQPTNNHTFANSPQKPITMVATVLGVVLLGGGLGWYHASKGSSYDKTIPPAPVSDVTPAPTPTISISLKDLDDEDSQPIAASDTNASLRKQFEQGLAHEKAGNITEAEQAYSAAANQNHVPAQVYLAALYRKQKDYANALTWYTKAAENGSEQATARLAMMHHKGMGVETNIPLAVKLYHEAIKNKVNAIYPYNNLASIYLLGEGGVAKDVDQAIKFYKMGADKNSLFAKNSLGDIYREKKQFKQAMNWYNAVITQAEKNSRLNNSDKKQLAQAQFYVGQFHERGSAVEKDENLAIEWYQKAAENGSANAQKALARLESANEVPQNPQSAKSTESTKSQDSSEKPLTPIRKKQPEAIDALF